MSYRRKDLNETKITQLSLSFSYLDEFVVVENDNGLAAHVNGKYVAISKQNINKLNVNV